MANFGDRLRRLQNEIVDGEDGDSSDSEDSDGMEAIVNIDELRLDLQEAEQDEDALDTDQDNASQTSGSGEDICYDKSLPGAHSYLGDDLEEIHGRIIHEDESYIHELPLLPLPNVVLVPGQTLPLHLFQPSSVAMMMNVIDHDKTFGLITTSYHRHDNTSMSPIGTTADVLAYKEESSEGISTLRVKAIGRQRFEIKETRRQVNGILRAKVLVLPEHHLPPPLEGASCPSQLRLCAYQDQPNESDSGSGDHLQVLKAWLRQNKPRKVNRLSSANYTWWPPWVYKLYDQYFLMKKIKEELRSWNESLNEAHLPVNPSDLSFWVAGNLPLDDRLKLMLLGIDNTVQRLRCELSIMQKYTMLCCKHCDLGLAEKRDMFSMAVEGPLGAYVNPHGHVHETITLYKARGIHLIGQPSTDSSWFPGYAWTIAQCRSCSQHLGWKFTATSKTYKPQMFWGLCRSSLKPGMQMKDGQTVTSEDDISWRPIL